MSSSSHPSNPQAGCDCLFKNSQFPWRWRRYFPQKLQLTFNGLHSTISRKIEHVIIMAVRISNLINVVSEDKPTQNVQFFYSTKLKINTTAHFIPLKLKQLITNPIWLFLGKISCYVNDISCTTMKRGITQIWLKFLHILLLVMVNKRKLFT
jgi:hypothetical protein